MMQTLNCIPPVAIGGISAILGLLLTDDLTAEQNNVIGNVLITAGQIMVTVAAQQANLSTVQSLKDQNAALCMQVEALKTQMACLDRKMGK